MRIHSCSCEPIVARPGRTTKLASIAAIVQADRPATGANEDEQLDGPARLVGSWGERTGEELAISRIEAVVFDVGETLVDETRAWGIWAAHLGIPTLTFYAALGAILAEGRSHRDVFELFAPGMDVDAAARLLGRAGVSDLASLDDLYPDALPCLHALTAAGYRLAVAANQPAPAADVVAAMGVDFEFIGTSAGWGVQKPDPRFFARVIDELDLPPPAIAYVGDRIDNDVIPASAAGMRAVFIRRGPWAWIQAGRGRPPEADIVIETLTELPEALTRPD